MKIRSFKTLVCACSTESRSYRLLVFYYTGISDANYKNKKSVESHYPFMLEQPLGIEFWPAVAWSSTIIGIGNDTSRLIIWNALLYPSNSENTITASVSQIQTGSKKHIGSKLFNGPINVNSEVFKWQKSVSEIRSCMVMLRSSTLF